MEKTCRPETASKAIGGWEDHVDIGLQNNESVEWLHLAQDTFRQSAVMNTVMKPRIPKNEGALLTGRETVSF